MTSTAILTSSGANWFAWCPQKTRSPPPARTIRSLPAALHRSQRSSAAGGAAASGGGVRVGVILASSCTSRVDGPCLVDSSFTHRPTSGPLTAFPEAGGGDRGHRQRIPGYDCHLPSQDAAGRGTGHSWITVRRT